MSVYKVVGNLKHNGAFFKAGEKMKLDDEEVAKALLADGVIEVEEVKSVDEPMTPEEKKAATESAPKESVESEPVEGEDAVEVAYEEMTKEELLKVCEAMGLTVSKQDTKAKLIKVIRSSEESPVEEL